MLPSFLARAVAAHGRDGREHSEGRYYRADNPRNKVRFGWPDLGLSPKSLHLTLFRESWVRLAPKVLQEI